MTPDKDAEIARLRRELEVALEAARVNGEERDELARQLGAEVATTQRLKSLLHSAQKHIPACLSLGGGMHLTCRARGETRLQWCVACVLDNAIDAALASGNGVRGGK